MSTAAFDPIRECPRKMATAQNDATLLKEIARERNQQAFLQLFERYQKPAFNLALYFTGRRELAEDALQDAMLSVWRYAGSFHSDVARSWIMRIVHRSSLAVLRMERRKKRKIEDDAGYEPESLLPQPGLSNESSEQQALLRNALQGLPAEDRRLIGLYYGAD